LSRKNYFILNQLNIDLNLEDISKFNHLINYQIQNYFFHIHYQLNATHYQSMVIMNHKKQAFIDYNRIQSFQNQWIIMN